MFDLHPDCNGQITILFNENGLNIEVYDQLSRECIVEINLDKDQTCEALSRVAYTPCMLRTGHLDRVGKKMLMDKLIFEIPYKGYDVNKKVEIAIREANIFCPEGWEPDKYYVSKDSFFTEDGKQYARTTIRRWE